MSNSFDIGSKLEGASAKGYVPGKLTRVYMTLSDPSLSKTCEAFIRRYVGEVELVNTAKTCKLCVFTPLGNQHVSASMWTEIETLFDRFGREALVYEYDPICEQLIARDRVYFSPARIL